MGAINNNTRKQEIDLTELKNVFGKSKVLKSLMNETEIEIPADYRLKLNPMSAELFLLVE